MGTVSAGDVRYSSLLNYLFPDTILDPEHRLYRRAKRVYGELNSDSQGWVRAHTDL